MKRHAKKERDRKRGKKTLGTTRENPITLDKYFFPVDDKKKSSAARRGVAMMSSTAAAANARHVNAQKKPSCPEVIDLLSCEDDDTKPPAAAAQSNTGQNQLSDSSAKKENQASPHRNQNHNSVSNNKKTTPSSRKSTKKPKVADERLIVVNLCDDDDDNNVEVAAATAASSANTVPSSSYVRNQPAASSVPLRTNKLNTTTAAIAAFSPSVNGRQSQSTAAPTTQNQILQQNKSEPVQSMAVSHTQQQQQQQQQDKAHHDNQRPNDWMEKGNNLYSLDEFKSMMASVEEDFGLYLVEIENGKLFTTSNNNMSSEDSKCQSNAMYGRVYPEAALKLFHMLELRRNNNEIFVDIGHGIGSLVFQAAYTIGCEARGIEVVGDRCEVSHLIKAGLSDLAGIHKKRDERDAPVGTVKLRHGSLVAPEHQDFLTEYSNNRETSADPVVIKSFLNNFNGVFKDRCGTNSDKYLLEDYVAGLFASMAPGSCLVTVDPLNLGPSLSEANEYRKKQGLDVSIDASFFEADTTLALGRANESLSWSYGGGCKHNVRAYKYTRVKNSTKEAVFLCSNPSCRSCISGTRIPAFRDIPHTVKIQDSKQRVELRRVVQTACPDCKMAPKTMRNRPRKR